MTVDDALRRLTAGLTEEERIARAAIMFVDANGEDDEDPGDAWVASPNGLVLTSIQVVTIACADSTMHSYGPDFAQHIAQQDPKATLRRVEAIRKVIDEHRRTGVGHCEVCREYDFRYDYNPVPWPCPTVRALADIYLEET